MVRFLRDRDYGVQIRNEILKVLQHGKDFTLHDAEELAKSQMEGMLSTRYDTAAIFSPLLPYALQSSYNMGDRVLVTADIHDANKAYQVNDLALYNEAVYYCLQDHDGKEPSDTTYWQYLDQDQALYHLSEAVPAGQLPAQHAGYVAGDNRNRYLVTLFIDVVLYHLHSNIAPRNIPEQRESRYKDAKTDLRMMEQGKRSYGLPIKAGKEGGKFRFSTNKPYSRRW